MHRLSYSLSLVRRLVAHVVLLALLLGAAAFVSHGVSRPLGALASTYTQKDAWDPSGGHGWLGYMDDGNGSLNYQFGEDHLGQSYPMYIHGRSWACGQLWYDQSWNYPYPVNGINRWTGWKYYGGCGPQADAYGEIYARYDWTWYLNY